MALHTRKFAETRSIVTRGLAVAAEEPAKRSGNQSRPSPAATLVRIWVHGWNSARTIEDFLKEKDWAFFS